MTESEDVARFERAIAAIDAANAEDPKVLMVEGVARPKELVHSELVTRHVETLVDAPSEALLLAARAHHLKRWKRPRSEHPEGLAGYHQWRRALQEFHADEAAKILAAAGYSADITARVGDLVRKRGLGREPEVQVLEDALCLVFLETQLETFAAQHSDQKVIDILVKSLKRMSAQGRAAAGDIALSEKPAALLALAVEVFAAAD